jgi:hypothetical protein
MTDNQAGERPQQHGGRREAGLALQQTTEAD